MIETGTLSYPSEFVDQSQKESDEYGLRWAKAFWSEWRNNGYPIYRHRVAQIIKNRLYAEGKQDVNQYKGYFDRDSNPQFLKLNWTIRSLLPKFVDVIHGRLMSRGESIIASAIDAQGLEQYRDDMAKMQAKIQLKDILDHLDILTGQKLDISEGFQPETPEELQLYMNTTYKQQEEIFAEEAMEWLNYTNDWETEKKSELIYDLIVDGIAGSIDFQDKNGEIKAERLDMIDAILGFSKHRNFKDMNKFGYIRRMTIGQIKEIAGNKFTEEQYKSMAEMYAGKNNQSIFSNDTYYNNDTYGDTSYINHTVEVMQFRFLSTDTMTFEQRFTGYGEGQYNLYQQPLNFKLRQSKEGVDNVIRKEIVNRYEGYWLIGTDYIFEYQLAENQRRERKVNGKISTDADLGVRIFRPNDKSVIERMIPFEDDYHLNYMKLAAAVARSKPKGMAMDMSALETVSTDGENWTPKGIRQMYEQTGDYIFRGSEIPGQNGLPFTELNNGIGAYGQELIELIKFSIEQMRLVSGLNEIVDASTAHPDQSVGNGEMMDSATSDAIKIIYSGYLDIKVRTFRSMLDRLQMMVKDNDIEAYIPVFGSTMFKFIKLSSDLYPRQFGIRIEARPMQPEIQRFEQYLNEALAAKDISLEDVFAVEQVMYISLKKAEQLLILRKSKRMQQSQSAEQMNIQSNAQAQQNSAAQTSQYNMQEKTHETDEDIRKAQAQLQFDKDKIAFQTENKIKELTVAESAKAAHSTQKIVTEHVLNAASEPEKEPSKSN